MSNQLNGIEQKDVIKKVTGKVVKLWEPKTFQGSKGESSMQGGEIEIDGQIYGLKFWDNNQNAKLIEGKVITLTSTRGKMGLHGVKLDHESFSKKDGTKVDRDVISVSKSGQVSLGEELPSAPSVAVPVAPAKVSVSDNGLSSIEEIVNFHVSIDRGVRSAYGTKYNEDTIRAYVSSVFIEANRRNITRLLKEDAAQPEAKDEVPSPEDWALAIVPSGSNKGKKLIEIGKPALTKLYQHFLDKGFNTPFAKCVEAAGDALKLDAWDVEETEADDIPY